MDKSRFIEKWGWLDLHERQLAVHPVDSIYRTRIYLLPEAKRYPATADENQEAHMHIQNVLSFLEIRRGSLLIKQYESENTLGELSGITENLILFRTLIVEGEPSFKLDILIAEFSENNRVQSVLVDGVMQDVIPEVYIVPDNLEVVVCIYDGGIDIYSTQEIANTLKKHFKDLVSLRRDML